MSDTISTGTAAHKGTPTRATIATPHTDALRLAENRWSFYLGKNREGLNVWGEIALTITPEWEQGKDGDGPRMLTLTDHTTVRASEVWRISTSYVLGSKNAPLASRIDARRTGGYELGDGYWYAAGQIGADERKITAKTNTRPELVKLFAEADVWHLNDTNAACDHMTDLEPTDAQLEANAAARIAAGKTPNMWGRDSAVQDWRLDTIVCPETGYRYGRQWLAKVPPADLVERIAELLITAGVNR